MAGTTMQAETTIIVETTRMQQGSIYQTKTDNAIDIHNIGLHACICSYILIDVTDSAC